MTNYDYIKNLSKEELAEWLDQFNPADDVPWVKWFDNKYCHNCEPVEGTVNKCKDFAYCEVNKNCRYFSYYPGAADTIKLWLESEIETNE